MARDEGAALTRVVLWVRLGGGGVPAVTALVAKRSALSLLEACLPGVKLVSCFCRCTWTMEVQVQVGAWTVLVHASEGVKVT